jgi:putative transposase
LGIYDPQKHHRRSMRLQEFDYAQAGAYFITLVTYHRQEFFGEIVDGIVRLSPLGEITQDEWMRSLQLRPEIRLYQDEFVVMPNHFHGVVWLIANGLDARDAPRQEPDVGVDRVDPSPNTPQQTPVGVDRVDPGHINPAVQGARGAPRQEPDVWVDRGDPGHTNPAVQGARGASLQDRPLRLPHSLSSFIAGFKSSVTRRAFHELGLTGIWQRNYYDHIIRNEEDFSEHHELHQIQPSEMDGGPIESYFYNKPIYAEKSWLRALPP